MKKKKIRAGITFYLGIIIFFYFGFDLMTNDYPWPGTLARLVLAGAGILVPLLLKLRAEKRDNRE